MPLEGDESVSVREFLTAELRHLREVFDVYAITTNKRLDDLNHARAEALQDRNLYVTKSYYDAKHEDLDRRLTMLDRTIAMSAAGSASVDAMKAQERRSFWLAAGLVVTMAGAAADLLITLIKHW